MVGRANQTPLLEWIIGLAGVVIVIGSVGFLIVQSLRAQPAHPRLDVHVVEIEPQPNGYLAVLRIANRGGATAQNAVVTGRLEAPDGPETSEVTIDYVPANSFRRAGLFFRADPREYPLEVRAEGYQRP